MGKETDKRRITAYPSPLNVKKVQQMAVSKGTSTSKIVNEALTKYFNEKPAN